MAFLKTIWKGHKHKKLSDEQWDLSPKEVEEEGVAGNTMEGITFSVKYVGSCPIASAASAKHTATAVHNICATAKSSNKKPINVQFAINLRGISISDTDTKDKVMDVSLYRIAYCSADAAHGHVFAFNSTDDKEHLECHAFLCPKRKMAQLMSITVAQTFNTAFHLWQMTHTNKGTPPPSKENGKTLTENLLKGCLPSNQEKRPSVIQQVLTPIPMLIDLTTPIEIQPQKPCQWASFED